LCVICDAVTGVATTSVGTVGALVSVPIKDRTGKLLVAAKLCGATKTAEKMSTTCKNILIIF